MRRRDVLAGAGSFAAGAATSLTAPAIAQGIRQLKLVTDWPAALPGLQASAERVAKSITALSGGHLAIDVFPAGTFVRPFETFDAVGSGIADMYHSADYYWEKKSPAFTFFCAVPFGFTANELFAWIHHGGGQELGDALYGQFNVKPLLCCNTGCQMGGWFNKEVGSPGDLNGLRYRMPGLGGEVLRRLGATVVNLPGGEIVPSLKSGAIDASEWIGPWADMALGLHKAAAYYYYPGFHEPGTGITLGINKSVWESFSAGDRRLIQDAAAAEYARSLAEFNASNASWLGKLREENAVKILKFDDSVLKAFVKISADVVAEAGASNELSKKVYDSYRQFRAPIMDWTGVAERAFLIARGAA